MVYIRLFSFLARANKIHSSSTLTSILFVDCSDFLIAFIPILFATGALFMGLLGTLYCETIGFEAITAGSDTLTFGVWYYKGYETVTLEPDDRVVVTETCYQYPSGTYFDAKWKTAMSFSIITPIIGGVVLFWSWLAPCWYVHQAYWKKMGMVFVAMTLFQGLTLLLLPSNACKNNDIVNLIAQEDTSYDQECSFAWGTKIIIAAVICWFMAGVLMLTAIPPPTRPEHPVETQTVTYTQTEQPDGTKVITEDVVKGEYIEPEKVGEPAAEP